jgi:WD40 repeat protein
VRPKYYIRRTSHTNAGPRYTKDGDILFSVAKDKIVCAWFSANGERLGTYHGHQGALWTVDINPSTTILATGAADNTVRLWNVQTGECLKIWDFPTAVKRVEFSEDGTQLLAVTEKRMGYLGSIKVFDVRPLDEEQTDEPSLNITCEESKATVAAWSFLDKYILAGHEDGSVSQYDAKVSLPKKYSDFTIVQITSLTLCPDWRTAAKLPSPRIRLSNQRPANIARSNLFHHSL